MSKKVVASSQITLVDLNDSRPMSLSLKANRSTTQVYNVNSGVYEPDYSKDPIVITPILFFGNEDASHKIGKEISYTINGEAVAYSGDGNIPQGAKGCYQFNEKLYIFQNMGEKEGAFDQNNNLLIEAYIPEKKVTDELTGLSNGYLSTTIDLVKLDTGLDGAEGAAARGITISGEQVFISSDGKAYLPEKITLAANCIGDLTVGKWYYKSSDNWVVIENSQNKTSLEILNSASYFQNNVATIKVVSEESEGYYDIMSIYKVSNGKDGENGEDGDSPFLVYITNENISFAADENGKVVGKTVVSYVKAQAGLEEVVPVINTNGIKGGISGQLTIQVGAKNENGVPITITALPESLLGGEEPQQGVIEIPITSPIVTTLSINWSKINSGKKGEDGRDSFGSHIEFLEGKNVFSEENKNGKITLRAHFTEGGLLVTNDITYQWSGSPTSIPNSVNRTSQTLEVTSNMITGANTFTCIMTNKDGVARASSASITDYSDPYICQIESSYGTEFVNTQGETKLTCVVFKGAEGQVDTQGTKYQYSWEKFNINDSGVRVKDSTWSAIDKTTPSILASEINDRAVFVCKVSYNNTLIGLAELWLYDRLDSATYIYYSANANGSGASITPDSNTKYIGIYSGPAFAIQPTIPPEGTKWSQYKGDKGDKGDKGETGSGYKIVYMQSLPEMTSAQWKNLQDNSTTRTWTTNKANTHIQVGDTAQISGKATDAKDTSGQNVTVVLVGQVTAINGSTSITINTSSVQIGGSAGKDGENGQMLYAICNDTGDVVNKTATLQSGSLTLNAGTIVAVKFVNTNTANNPTINIGQKGKFPIYLGDKLLTADSAIWNPNAIINLVYNEIDGKGRWEIVNGSELESIKAINTVIERLDGEIDLRVTTEEYKKLQIGGRNLIKTDFSAFINTSLVEVSSEEKKLAMGLQAVDTAFKLYAATELDTETEYTLSCKAESVPDDVISAPEEEPKWVFGVGDQYNSNFKLIINKNGLCYGTGKLSKNYVPGEIITIDDISRTTLTTPIYLKDFKLEVGNKPTDWTPATEEVYNKITKVSELVIGEDSITSRVGELEGDMSTWVQKRDSFNWQLETKVDNVNTNAQSAAADAKKQATDGMQFSSYGLEIGDRRGVEKDTWTPNTYRARIDGYGYYIVYQNGTYSTSNLGEVVASFLNDSIYLGRNSVNSTIDFCNGQMQITYGEMGNFGGKYTENLSRIISDGSLAIEAPKSIGLFTQGSGYNCYIKIGPQSSEGDVKAIELITDQGTKGKTSLAINYADIIAKTTEFTVTGNLTSNGLILNGIATINGNLNLATGKLTVNQNAEIGETLQLDKELYYNSSGKIGGINNSSGNVTLYATGALAICGESGYGRHIILTKDGIRPSHNTENAVLQCGLTGYRWKSIWSVNALNIESDRNKKKDIKPISGHYIDFFNSLNPVSYYRIYKTSDRAHLGFISQEVEESLLKANLTALDFGGFCKDIKTEEVEVINPDTGLIDIKIQPVVNQNGEFEYNYSLCYEEFIALNTKMIQLNQQKIKEQQETIEQLKQQIEELKEIIYQKFENSSNL